MCCGSVQTKRSLARLFTQREAVAGFMVLSSAYISQVEVSRLARA